MKEETGQPHYPAWICAPCGQSLGRPRGRFATFHNGDRCGWCDALTSTTEPRDYSYPPFPRLAILKAVEAGKVEGRELGLRTQEDGRGR